MLDAEWEWTCLVAGYDLPDLSDLIRRPAWMARAACRTEDTATFFPEVGQPADGAREICSTCPVAEPCLRFALDGHEPGVWAGTSARERQRLRKKAG